MTAAQAADLLGITERTLRARIARREELRRYDADGYLDWARILPLVRGRTWRRGKRAKQTVVGK